MELISNSLLWFDRAAAAAEAEWLIYHTGSGTGESFAAASVAAIGQPVLSSQTAAARPAATAGAQDLQRSTKESG